MVITGSPDWSDPFLPDSQLDSLGSFVIPNLSATFVQTLELNQGSYKYFAIQVSVPSTTLVGCRMNGGPINRPGPYFRYTVSAGPALFLLPGDGVLNETASVALSFQPALAGGTGVLAVTGVRNMIEGLRFDGLLPPQGSLTATWVPTNGVSTVVAAPTSPQRILIARADAPIYVATAGTVGLFLRGLIQGSTLSWATVFAGTTTGGGGSYIYPEGLLLDPGQPLQTSGTGALTTVGNGIVGYDLVS